MNNYIQKTLKDQRSSLITEPMHPSCQVVVLIPVFNENTETLLMPLLSLAEQEQVAFNDFEVTMIVSNNYEAAKRRSKEFLQNQKTLRLLKFICAKSERIPSNLSLKQRCQINFIKTRKLAIRYIDKSSLKYADQFDNANHARNLAGAEICQRFIDARSIGRNGIIALTDCDCRFSKNYLAEIISTFKNKAINRMAGSWLLEADKNLKYGELVEHAYLLTSQRNYLFQYFKPPKKRLSLKLQKLSGSEKFVVAVNGQSMCIRVSAWVKAGGIRDFYSFDDIIFGQKVSNLPGKTVYNPNCWVVTLLRSSERVGVVSLGKRVGIINDSILNYMNGEAANLVLPNWQKTLELFNNFVKLLNDNQLNTQNFVELLNKFDLNHEEIGIDAVNELIALVSKKPEEILKTFGHNKIEVLLLEKFYPHLPKHLVPFVRGKVV